jgi:hypothetical protein
LAEKAPKVCEILGKTAYMALIGEDVHKGAMQIEE